jgi:hypothetical protein
MVAEFAAISLEKANLFRLSQFSESAAPVPALSWAAGLAVGKSVQELVEFYTDAGSLMFDKTNLLARLCSSYQVSPLRNNLTNFSVGARLVKLI